MPQIFSYKSHSPQARLIIASAISDFSEILVDNKSGISFRSVAWCLGSRKLFGERVPGISKPGGDFELSSYSHGIADGPRRIRDRVLTK